MSRQHDKWLTYYFALPIYEIKMLADMGMHGDFLISFAHFHHSTKMMQKAVDTAHGIRKANERIMLDSGAFTNKTKPGTVRLEPYIEFLQSHAKDFDEFVTLDVIGSRKGTLDNYAALRKASLRPLFVDHLELADHPTVVDSIWKSEPKICLAGWGTNPLTHHPGKNKGAPPDRRPKDLPIHLAKKVAIAREKKTKLHLLAVGSLSKFLPHLDVIQSVDSAVVFRAVGYGQILHCTTKDVGGVKVPILSRHAHPDARTQQHQPITPECKRKLAEFLRGRNFTTKIAGYRAFCFHEITRYISELNKMSQADLMAAFDRHKQAQSKAELRTFFWLGDGADGYDDWPMVPANEALADSAVEKAALCLSDLTVRAGYQTLADVAIGNAERTLKAVDSQAVEWFVQKATTLQTLVLSKEEFKTLEEAVAWVKDHNFKVEYEGKAPDETSTSYRFRQVDPKAFEEGSFRTIDVRPGVKAVIGVLKQKDAAAKADDSDEPADSSEVRLLPVEKADEERQIVLGIVLEPDEVDTQEDTVGDDEIEGAAHLWLARFQDRGLMHEKIVNSKIEIYESYIAPVNLTIGGQRVKKGTWLLMYHVTDDALWKDIKSGKLTGFSMGGFARRKPA